MQNYVLIFSSFSVESPKSLNFSRSRIPYLSKNEGRIFIDEFPPVDFVTFTDGTLEYRSIATKKLYIFLLYDPLLVLLNLTILPDPAAVGVWWSFLIDLFSNFTLSGANSALRDKINDVFMQMGLQQVVSDIYHSHLAWMSAVNFL